VRKPLAVLSPLQIALLLSTIIIIVASELAVYVRAQAVCNPPPLLPDWSATHWPKFKNIKVEIDDAWDGALRGKFQTGISKWNGANVENCSIVTFTDFTPRHFTDYISDAPADTVWWLKADPGSGYNGGVFTSYTGTPPFLTRQELKSPLGILITPIILFISVVMRWGILLAWPTVYLQTTVFVVVRTAGLGRVPRREAVIGLGKRCGGPTASQG